ncbi:AraC-like DNA-binding protein [Dinghuibacter silviterrae]|uniref:AraC-like DNA-binding protein n=2 Tax=Dinghuibacter silviterrae TaxID=1539049 RepID=A0A4R8DMY3_9BACT|nr:AraC-like DNA-binding protein [Dinghuibacter silviterrae]
MASIQVRVLKEPDFTGSFNIRDIGALLSGKDMIQELHRHSYYFVLALERGHGEHSIDFVSYPVGDYSIYFMRPGQVHKLVLKNGCSGFLMEFTGDFYAPMEKAARQVLRSVSGRNFCPLDAARSKKLLDTLSNIFEEYTSKQERYLDVIRSSLDIFFIELLRQCKSQKDFSDGGSEHYQELLEAFQELLAQQVVEHKTVAYYADRLHITPYQLNAVTKATLGKTCSGVIIDHIILEARRYLLATSSQVNQVAGHLGYEDVSYFIRFFKKHTGYSPETFRRKFA